MSALFLIDGGIVEVHRIQQASHQSCRILGFAPTPHPYTPHKKTHIKLLHLRPDLADILLDC